MNPLKWHEEPVAKTHDRESFDCGDSALNEFLLRHARKSHEAGGAKTFLAIGEFDNHPVFGYYTLAPASIALARVPDLIKKGLAKHEIPGFRLARLAVDRRMQGQGLGGQLLLAAGRRCILVAQEVGGVVLAIDAKNAKVANWYASFGALPLLDSPLSLVIHLNTMEQALNSATPRRSH